MKHEGPSCVNRVGNCVCMHALGLKKSLWNRRVNARLAREKARLIRAKAANRSVTKRTLQTDCDGCDYGEEYCNHVYLPSILPEYYLKYGAFKGCTDCNLCEGYTMREDQDWDYPMDPCTGDEITCNEACGANPPTFAVCPTHPAPPPDDASPSQSGCSQCITNTADQCVYSTFHGTIQCGERQFCNQYDDGYQGCQECNYCLVWYDLNKCCEMCDGDYCGQIKEVQIGEEDCPTNCPYDSTPVSLADITNIVLQENGSIDTDERGYCSDLSNMMLDTFLTGLSTNISLVGKVCLSCTDCSVNLDGGAVGKTGTPVDWLQRHITAIDPITKEEKPCSEMCGQQYYKELFFPPEDNAPAATSESSEPPCPGPNPEGKHVNAAAFFSIAISAVVVSVMVSIACAAQVPTRARRIPNGY